MIGAFPRGERWVTLQLAADHHKHRPRLLELLGACPGDPDAQITTTTTCESADAALAHSAARLRRGWAAHASVDAPGDARDATVALDAPAWTPAVAITDTALAPEQARSVVAHATAATREPFCLFPNPTAGHRAYRGPARGAEPMHATRLILLAEEDPVIRTFLADNLTADGYEMLIAEDRAGALRLLEAECPDLVVCDVNGDTLSLLDAVRGGDGVASRIDPDTPLIVLTGHTDELSRLRYFDRGSDDVIAKPFSYHELRARVRALLARAYERTRGRLRIGELTIDPTSRQVHLRGEPVALASREFALLRQLASNPTRVHTKEELLRTIWGSLSYGSGRTLDTHACRLRQKLRRDGDQFVVTVWGIGYRLVDGPLRREQGRASGESAA
jgi:DNA-binding response OmpR family regulator